MSLNPSNSFATTTIHLPSRPYTQSPATSPGETQVEQDSPEMWVAKLGNADPDIRAQAEIELLELGEKAADAVNANIHSDDNEIQLRCQRLMIKIKTRSELAKRTQFLEAGIDDMTEGGFASWPTFRDASNGSQSARRLYLSIDEHLHKLFQLINQGSSPDLIAKARSMTTYAAEGQPPTALLAAFVLANMVDQEKNPDRPITNVTKKEALTFILRPVFTESWKESDSSNEVRQLVSSWLNTMLTDNAELTRHDFQVIYEYELSELTQTLAASWNKFDFLSQRRWFDCAQRGLSKEQLPVVIDKFDDDSILVSALSQEDPANKINVQVRDCALFTAIKIGGNNPVEFGFVETTTKLDFSVEPIMGFDNNRKRELAFRQFEKLAESKSQETE